MVKRQKASLAALSFKKRAGDEARPSFYSMIVKYGFESFKIDESTKPVLFKVKTP